MLSALRKKQFVPFLIKNLSFGPNWLACTQERGALDALAHMVLACLMALAKGGKVAIYCSDVSGAFDRVRVDRFAEKQKAEKLHPAIVGVISSWVRDRKTHVVVGGERSVEILLEDVVLQGTVWATVWGPTPWNLFYEDARRAKAPF